jgi:hypothetical protein
MNNHNGCSRGRNQPANKRIVESDDEIVERIAEQIDERHADEESAYALDYLACREDAEFRNANQK